MIRNSNRFLEGLGICTHYNRTSICRTLAAMVMLDLYKEQLASLQDLAA